MITLSHILRIVEIRTKIVSLSGVAIGTSYVWYRYADLELPTLVVYVAAVLAVDMATTGFNTFFDYYFGVDRRETNREADKVLVHQGVAAGPALLVSLALYAVAGVLGLVLAFIASPWVIPIGAVSMAIGFLYNAGPIPISRTPVGDLVAGGFLGWVLVTLTIFVLAPGRMHLNDVLVGIPSLLMVASILTVNNTCDLIGDRAAGRRTLSIVVGRHWSERIIYILGAAAGTTLIVLVVSGILPSLTVLTLASALGVILPTYRHMHRRGFSHRTKGPSMGSISTVFGAYTLGVVIPLILSAAGFTLPLP